ALHLREKRIRIRPFGLAHEAILLTITVRANQIKDHGRGDGQPYDRSIIVTEQRVRAVGFARPIRVVRPAKIDRCWVEYGVTRFVWGRGRVLSKCFLREGKHRYDKTWGN